MNRDTDFLKLVALVSMVIDHIGAVFFPGIIIFRILGRLAYPLFFYCAALGFYYSHDRLQYINRVMLFAVLSQPFYMAVFQSFRLNILFTLCLSLLILYSADTRHWFLFGLFGASAFLFPIEYGFSSIALMLVFHYMRDDRTLCALSAFCVLFFCYPTGLQKFAVLALPLILIPMHFRIKLDRRFYYWFYPSHLAVLTLAKILFS